MMAIRTISFLFLLCVYVIACDAQTITPEQAKDSIGKHLTVCGKAVDTYRSKQDGTLFINFGDVYPHQTFTIVIFEKDAKNFTTDYKDRDICVTGVIKLYKERPEIEVSEPSQIVIHDASK